MNASCWWVHVTFFPHKFKENLLVVNFQIWLSWWPNVQLISYWSGIDQQQVQLSCGGESFTSCFWPEEAERVSFFFVQKKLKDIFKPISWFLCLCDWSSVRMKSMRIKPQSGSNQVIIEGNQITVVSGWSNSRCVETTPSNWNKTKDFCVINRKLIYVIWFDDNMFVMSVNK